MMNILGFIKKFSKAQKFYIIIIDINRYDVVFSRYDLRDMSCARFQKFETVSLKGRAKCSVKDNYQDRRI